MHIPSSTSLGRDCQTEQLQHSFSSLCMSSLVIHLISPLLIRGRCQSANKISSFNISLNCECFKENEGSVTPWLFLLSATHLPLGQSVPIRVYPSSPSTLSPLPAFLLLFNVTHVFSLLFSTLINPKQAALIHLLPPILLPGRKS